jgi:Fic family protein
MPTKFEPNYTITSKIMKALMRIEAVKEKVLYLPLNSTVLLSLRETARLYTTHYSTMIEGNRLDPDQIKIVLQQEGHFPGRERDADEVKGYYAALTQVEKWAALGLNVTEKMIKTLHALVMANGKTNIKPTEYRSGQNVIKDSRTKAIVYMPPEAKDVPGLTKSMISWINNSTDLPYPIIAGVAHYQFATINPYYDGNGRTARLLTTLILHLGGYDLKGLYSLEEYYAKNLGAYYDAISIGESHNYYMGRANADITKWIEYFVGGMAVSFENVFTRMQEAKSIGLPDTSEILRKLDPRQRKVLELFMQFEFIKSSQIGKLFGFKSRTSASLCASWVCSGFLKIVDQSKKGRKYALGDQYTSLIHQKW